MKTSLKIYATNAGETVNTTLGYVISTATNAQYVAAAQALNALTTNTYQKTIKITEEEVDE